MHSRRATNPVDGLLHAVEASVLIAAVQAESAMRARGLEAILGEKPVSPATLWVLRTEMLCFFLHMASRYALAAGGQRLCNGPLEAVSRSAFRAMAAASFRIDTTDQNRGAQPYDEHTLAHCLERLDEVHAEYGGCRSLAWEDSMSAEESVVGRLWARIGRDRGQSHGPELWAVLYPSTIESLARSRLRATVEKACKALG